MKSGGFPTAMIELRISIGKLEKDQAHNCRMTSCSSHYPGKASIALVLCSLAACQSRYLLCTFCRGALIYLTEFPKIFLDCVLTTSFRSFNSSSEHNYPFLISDLSLLI